MLKIILLLLLLPLSINESKIRESIMDENRKKAIEMAASMDKFQDDYAELDRERFLDTISMIESSGGKNFNHARIPSGIHEGHRAAGRYGLMPNTIQEIANRMRQEGTLEPELERVTSLPPDEMKAAIENNPDYEQKLAEHLAGRVLDRQGGDEEKAAYSWFQGHNLTPQEIRDRNYKEHDYVQKFNKFRNIKGTFDK